MVAMWSERSLGTPDELAKLKRVEQEIAAASRKIKAAKDAANDQLLATARTRLADYLLVAAERENQKKVLAVLGASPTALDNSHAATCCVILARTVQGSA